MSSNKQFAWRPTRSETRRPHISRALRSKPARQRPRPNPVLGPSRGSIAGGGYLHDAERRRRLGGDVTTSPVRRGSAVSGEFAVRLSPAIGTHQHEVVLTPQHGLRAKQLAPRTGGQIRAIDDDEMHVVAIEDGAAVGGR